MFLSAPAPENPRIRELCFYRACKKQQDTRLGAVTPVIKQSRSESPTACLFISEIYLSTKVEQEVCLQSQAPQPLMSTCSAVHL